MRVAVATAQVPFVRGGAEMLADNLLTALREAGHEADLLTLPFKWYPPARAADSMLAARLASTGQADCVIALKFPAYLIPHGNKRLWLLHQHRSAYDLWDAPTNELRNAPDGPQVRDAIRAADAVAFGEARSIRTIGRVVSERLRRFNHVDAPPLLHPPPGAARLAAGPHGDYVLAPGRLNPSKRQDLLLEALAMTDEPVRMLFIGAADDAAYARRLELRAAALQLGDRVRFAGGVPDAERNDLLAGCMAVAYVPQDEDYGYVTLEAMLCAKPLLTASDAGGPLDFVQHRRTGLVCPPAAAPLAAALDELWCARAEAAHWGAAGRDAYHALGLDWRRVADTLLA